MTAQALRRLPAFHPLRASVLAVLLVAGLGACSKKEEGAAAQATQVAAKVGDSEISVHQINQVLSRTPMEDPSHEAVQSASRQILERLIDQQVAVAAATEDNLQRTPEVIAAIEAARREVLARAYLQKVAANLPKTTPEEVAQYYRENPALFAERRIFQLQEIRLADGSAVLADLHSLAEQGKTADEVAAMLRAKQVRFGSSSSTRTAEQLPLDALPRIHALKDGQAHVFESGKAATYVRVVSSQSAAISESDAAPVIEKFLHNRNINDTVKQEIKRLRAATTISYEGDFAQSAATPAATSAASSADAGALERGVQGLK